MLRNKFVKIFLIFSLIFALFFYVYLNFLKKEVTSIPEQKETEETIVNSNIIKDVNYTSKDANGNEYIVTALMGEIDYSNPDIIFLTTVKALIKLSNSEKITIISDFGKYNSANFDTIFSKNVIINYLDNRINGEYLDFSLERNSMVVSKNVIYTNLENILKADIVEINIDTKDTKIFMYEKDKKVNIKNR